MAGFFLDIIQYGVRLVTKEQATYMSNDSVFNAWVECEGGRNHPFGIVAPSGKLRFGFSVKESQLTVRIYEPDTDRTKTVRLTCPKGVSWIIKNTGVQEQQWTKSIWKEKRNGKFLPWLEDTEARAQDVERQLREIAGASRSLPNKPKRLPVWRPEDMPPARGRAAGQDANTRYEMYKEAEDKIRDVFRSNYDDLCDKTIPDSPLINVLYAKEFFSKYRKTELIGVAHPYNRADMLYNLLDDTLEGYRIQTFLDCMKKAGNKHIVENYFSLFTLE